MIPPNHGALLHSLRSNTAGERGGRKPQDAILALKMIKIWKKGGVLLELDVWARSNVESLECNLPLGSQQ